jgi:tryptophan-rich sensory protein
MSEDAPRLALKRQLLGLLGWLALCFAVSALGAVASLNASDFYARLAQPDWAPPGWLFGPVWTTLYAMMAVSAWLVWREGGFGRQGLALGLFLAQLALNALWSWLFFAWQMGGAAFIEVLVLWLAIAATLVAFWLVAPLAGVLLLPYLAWVSFAAVLNFSVWRLNPALL